MNKDLNFVKIDDLNILKNQKLCPSWVKDLVFCYPIYYTGPRRNVDRCFLVYTSSSSFEMRRF